MAALVLDAAQIESVLPMGECIEAMAEALAALARGQAFQPLRSILRPPGAAGILGLMPAFMSVSGRSLLGLKVIEVFPRNHEKGLPSHLGVVLLLSGDTGELLAILNASAITAIRTAAVSAVATRALAREDAGDLAVLGASVQARTHIEALSLVRRLRRVRIASRSFASASALAASLGPSYPFPVLPVASAEEAVRGADLVVTATSSSQPVLRREWIAEGCHLNAVGASVSSSRELDSATVAASRLFVDRRESTVNEAGDYLVPLQEGAIGPDHIRAEIGEVLVGAAPGRTSAGEITVFKSLGLAVEDLAAGERAFRRAREISVGTWIEV